MGGWLAGLVMGFILSFIFTAFVDRSVHAIEKTLEKAYQVCNIANSTPKRYDSITVTCENGAQMKFSILEEE